MKSAEGTSQPRLCQWLGAGLRLLVTLLFLLLILALSRCGPSLQHAASTPTLVAATARLQIEIQPYGATIFVDGFKSGSTPASLTLSPGLHTIRVEQEGYEPWVEALNLAAKSDRLLRDSLVPLVTSPASTGMSTPAEGAESRPAQPDLAVQQIQIELESGGACDYRSTQLGTRVWIANVGGADAGPFVVEVNGVAQSVPDGLASGQTISLWFAGYIHDGENTVLVDSTSEVQDPNRGNNATSQRLPVPTLPPTCTPLPARLPTATPTAPPPTSTASPPTATPSPPVAVTMREGQVTIPTYPYASFTTQAWNQAFNMPYDILDRAAYDASNPAPTDMTYHTFVVENEYLKLTFLPDLGGRLYEVIYKPGAGAEHRVTYRNPVLKPSPWGPPEQGWWLAAGGFEWCLPVEEHGYTWGVPWKLSATHDGRGVTVTLRDSNAEDRVRAEIAVRLEAGAGSFTIRPRLENPTTLPLNVKYWTNAMLAPGGQNAPSAELRFVLPDAVSAVTVHSRGDDTLPGYNERLPWPVFSGLDLSRLGNWNRWLGFFEDPAIEPFIAVYDEGYDEGVVRVFPADVARGAKGFAFGWKDPIPAGNWTDDGSSYVELHGGPASTFDQSVTIPAGSHLQWTETWYPVAGLGGLRYANNLAALNLTASGGRTDVAVAVTRPWSGYLVLLLNRQERWRQEVSLLPAQSFRDTITLEGDVPQTGRLTLRLETHDGAVAAEYDADLTLK